MISRALASSAFRSFTNLWPCSVFLESFSKGRHLSLIPGLFLELCLESDSAGCFVYAWEFVLTSGLTHNLAYNWLWVSGYSAPSWPNLLLVGNSTVLQPWHSWGRTLFFLQSWNHVIFLEQQKQKDKQLYLKHSWVFFFCSLLQL